MKLEWSFDTQGDVSYNAACAIEIMIINLGLVDYEDQWDICATEAYSLKYEVKQYGDSLDERCKEKAFYGRSDSQVIRKG